MGQRSVGGDDIDVVDVITARIGRRLEIRRGLEGDCPAAGNIEQRCICAAQPPCQNCACIGIGASRLIDDPGAVLRKARRSGGGDTRRLVEVGDGDRHSPDRAAQSAIGCGDCDVIDVVAAHIRRRLEVRRRLEGHGARGADVEQGHIGAAEQPGQRRARIRVARGGLVDGTRRVLGEIRRPVGGDDRRCVDEAVGVDRGVGEVQRLDIACDDIGAIADDREQVGRAVIGDRVVRRRAIEEDGVGAGAADQRVAAYAAHQRVVAGAAVEHVAIAIAGQ